MSAKAISIRHGNLHMRTHSHGAHCVWTMLDVVDHLVGSSSSSIEGLMSSS